MTYDTDDIERMLQTLASTVAELAEAVRTRNYKWQDSHGREEKLKDEVKNLGDRIGWLEGLVSDTVEA